jgi:hypothetical protein
VFSWSSEGESRIYTCLLRSKHYCERCMVLPSTSILSWRAVLPHCCFRRRNCSTYQVNQVQAHNMISFSFSDQKSTAYSARTLVCADSRAVFQDNRPVLLKYSQSEDSLVQQVTSGVMPSSCCPLVCQGMLRSAGCSTSITSLRDAPACTCSSRCQQPSSR